MKKRKEKNMPLPAVLSFISGLLGSGGKNGSSKNNILTIGNLLGKYKEESEEEKKKKKKKKNYGNYQSIGNFLDNNNGYGGR